MTKFKRFLSKMEDDIVKNKVKEEIRFLLYNKRNINNSFNDVPISKPNSSSSFFLFGSR